MSSWVGRCFFPHRRRPDKGSTDPIDIARDWGRDLQLVLDLVRADSGVFGTVKDPKDASQWIPEKQIPVHFSNPDLLWGNEFSVSRFGQGALQESMAAVYKKITGHELQRSVLIALFFLSPFETANLTRALYTIRETGGKPSRATYDYAASLLASQIDHAQHGTEINLHPSPDKVGHVPGRVYMVGDNPASDIAGANNYGWESILVQTGVFRGARPEEAEHVPKVVAKDVLEGVKWALRREGEGEAVSQIPDVEEGFCEHGPRGDE